MVFDAEPFIAKMERTLKEVGYTVLTIEYDENHRMITRTVPVDNIIYLRGACLFTYQGAEMFLWQSQENYRIYEGEGLKCDFIIERLPTRMSKESLRKVVDKCYEEYGWSYNYFGTVSDVDKFADEYYLDDESRRLLHCAVIEKKMEIFHEKYGGENPILKRKLEEYS